MIDYELLAKKVVDELQARAIIPGASGNEVLRVEDIRQRLGRRGRPMAHITFVRNFIETGLLSYAPQDRCPDRRRKYIFRSDWERVSADISKNEPFQTVNVPCTTTKKAPTGVPDAYSVA